MCPQHIYDYITSSHHILSVMSAYSPRNDLYGHVIAPAPDPPIHAQARSPPAHTG